MASPEASAGAAHAKTHPGVTSFGGPPGAQHWPNYFGLPLGGELALKQQIDPYQRFPRETLHLPEVYKGHNPYLTQVMIEFITEEQLTPIRVILPLRETVNESSIVWDEYNFNNALLGPVPEEGVSRLVTQQISERQDHYVRGGLAFMIEHGFWRSEKGKQNYVLQLTQIKNATLDGLYIGVLESLLTCKNVATYAMQQLGNNNSDRLMRSLKLEVEAFAEVQKSPNGWDMLNSRAHKALKGLGYVPDCWVVDEGTKRYISLVRPENSQYLLGGPEGRALYDSALPASSNPKLLDQRTGCLIFETKSFESPDAKEPVNPMTRPQTIGEYNFSGPFFPVTRTDPYTSASRTISVYDESRDGWAYLSLADGLEHCGRFKTGPEEKHHYESFIDDHARGDLADANDMFTCTFDTDSDGKPEKKVAKYIGDINPKINMENGIFQDGLPEEAVNDWTNSVIQGLEPEIESALRDLLDVVNRIENDISKTESGLYLSKVATQANAGKGLTKEGLVDLLSIYNEKAQLSCQPHGFSSCAGLDELSKDAYATCDVKWLEDLHRRIKPGMRAFNRLYARLESTCYDNVFFRESAVPTYYRRPEGRYAFFSNLFHVPLPAMVFGGNSADKTDVFDSEKCEGLLAELIKTEHGAAPKFYTSPVFAAGDEYNPKKAFMAVLNPENNSRDQIAKKDLTTEYESLRPIFETITTRLINAVDTAMLDQEMTNTATRHFAKILAFYRFERFHEDDEAFFLFVDRVIPAHLAYKKFAQTFNLLAIGTNVKNMSSESGKNSQYELDSPKTELTDDQTIFKPDINLHSDGECEMSAMVASTAIMECALLAKSGIKFTKDVVGDATKPRRARGRRREYMYDTDDTDDTDDTGEQAAVRTMRKGVNNIAANLNSLPATVGGAAFAEIATMAGEHDGVTEPVRFNFTDNAAIQRALKRKHYEVDSDNRHSNAFEDRFNRLNGEPEIMTRVVKQALLGVPLTKRALNHFIARDVVFPFNILYFRPDMTYEMASGVCLKCGAGTGETLIGQSDFQMGDDVQRKVHFGHYTIKYKSVVYNHRAVYHAYNYMCNGYVGGNDARFVTRNSKQYFEQTHKAEYFHSIYACLVPYERKSYPNPMEPMYTSGNARNTVVFQGHQAMYNPRTMREGFTTVIENTGHWGRNVYPGVGKVRAGLASAINQVSYNDAYGGAAQQSHATF